MMCHTALFPPASALLAVQHAPDLTWSFMSLPGILAQTVVFGSTITGSSLAEDLQKGLIDRFRSLPMARSAVLVGRTTADVGLNSISIAVMVVTGHFGNWELAGYVFGLIGFPGSAIARPLDNPYLDRFALHDGFAAGVPDAQLGDGPTVEDYAPEQHGQAISISWFENGAKRVISWHQHSIQ